MRFLLDEDLSPRIAAIARDLDLDVISVHEIGRTGRSDHQQLTFAAAEERIMVTRNRDDFLNLTKLFFATDTPHHGVLIAPRTMSNRRPEVVADALQRWSERYRERSPGLGFADFLG